MELGVDRVLEGIRTETAQQVELSLHFSGHVYEIIDPAKGELHFRRTGAWLPIRWSTDAVHAFIELADDFHDPRSAFGEGVLNILVLDFVEVNFHYFSFLAKSVALQDLFG